MKCPRTCRCTKYIRYMKDAWRILPKRWRGYCESLDPFSAAKSHAMSICGIGRMECMECLRNAYGMLYRMLYGMLTECLRNAYQACHRLMSASWGAGCSGQSGGQDELGGWTGRGAMISCDGRERKWNRGTGRWHYQWSTSSRTLRWEGLRGREFQVSSS